MSARSASSSCRGCSGNRTRCSAPSRSNAGRSFSPPRARPCFRRRPTTLTELAVVFSSASLPHLEARGISLSLWQHTPKKVRALSPLALGASPEPLFRATVAKRKDPRGRFPACFDENYMTAVFIPAARICASARHARSWSGIAQCSLQKGRWSPRSSACWPRWRRTASLTARPPISRWPDRPPSCLRRRRRRTSQAAGRSVGRRTTSSRTSAIPPSCARRTSNSWRSTSPDFRRRWRTRHRLRTFVAKSARGGLSSSGTSTRSPLVFDSSSARRHSRARR